MWAAAPYRRGDRGAPSSPERTIEHEILGPGSKIAAGHKCLGGAIVGGINAVPLTSTLKIEADLLLLVEHTNGPHLYLAEVKAMATRPGTRRSSSCGSSGFFCPGARPVDTFTAQREPRPMSR